jgi:hypothetical protein
MVLSIVSLTLAVLALAAITMVLTIAVVVLMERRVKPENPRFA